MTRSCGEIGRRAGFRFQWATVWVQVPSTAPKHRVYARCFLRFFDFFYVVNILYLLFRKVVVESLYVINDTVVSHQMAQDAEISRKAK